MEPAGIDQKSGGLSTALAEPSSAQSAVKTVACGEAPKTVDRPTAAVFRHVVSSVSGALAALAAGDESEARRIFARLAMSVWPEDSES